MTTHDFDRWADGNADDSDGCPACEAAGGLCRGGEAMLTAQADYHEEAGRRAAFRGPDRTAEAALRDLLAVFDASEGGESAVCCRMARIARQALKRLRNA